LQNEQGQYIINSRRIKANVYHVVIKELSVPAARNIGIALRDWKTASLAVKRFLEYLDYRNQKGKKILYGPDAGKKTAIPGCY
jgi:hypothetical protein